MVMSRDPGFKNFYFSPNPVLKFWKIYQIWGKLAQEQNSYRQKTNWGWKTPPVLIGLTLFDMDFFALSPSIITLLSLPQ